jgi:CubicO group peptidase (beta-lactamase class C family)
VINPGTHGVVASGVKIAYAKSSMIAARIFALSCVLVGAVGFVSAPAASAQEPSDPPLDRIERLLEDRFEALRSPGAAWAIVSPEGIVRSGTHGLDGGGAPVTTGTPFIWGSVSKPVTATAVMTLVESGAVDLDERVQVYLPSFALADAEAARRITVRHLLVQTSGIPERTGITDRFGTRTDPYGEAVARLARIEPIAEPGERHQYSSANYLVLGALVEAVAGMPFERYLQGHVLGPLGMDQPVATVEAAEAVPRGHGYMFGRRVTLRVRYDPTGPSYGNLGGSLEDLAGFAAFHLGGGPPVLDDASLDLMHTGTAVVGTRHTYGLGWRDLTTSGGTRIVWHGGAAPGFTSVVALLPELGLGVVILQNLYVLFQDADLVRTGLDAARVLAGEEVRGAVGGATYPAILVVLAAIQLVLLILIAWTVRGTLRSRSEPPSRRRVIVLVVVWSISALGLAYAAGVAVPGSAGTELRVMRLFAPDIGGLLTAITLTAIVLAAARIGWGFANFRGGRA